MKAETLKKAILQYAMQGKWVEQNPNDEPASILLERIKAEKEQLIKDGKIKKEKPLPPIAEDEIPYELPKGWEWIRLGNLSIINGGYAFKSNEYVNQGVRVIRISDFDELGLKKDKIVYYTEDKKYDDFILENNDILLAMTGGTVGKSYYVQNLHEIMYVNQRVADIKISQQVNSKYINYLILSPLTQDKVASCKNSTNDNISMQDIKEFYVPLPPLEEQERIVEKLEQILPLVEEYGRNEEKLSKLNSTLPDKIKQSILQYAVQGKLVPQNPDDEPASVLLKRIKAEKEQLIKDGKIKKEKPLPPITDDEINFQIPDSWEWVNLDSITAQIHYGYTASAESYGSAKLLRITDIQNNKVLWENVPFCSISDNDIKKYKLSNRDILIARTGGTIGKTYIVDNLSETAVFASYLIRAIPLNNINEKYIKIFMESSLYWEQLKSYSMGTGQPNVNGQSLSKLIIPLPPLAEQQRIVTKIEELLAIVESLKV